jgi:choline-sulfatase
MSGSRRRRAHSFVAVALAAGLCGACATKDRERVRPNILLITIDTWRADRLGIGVSPGLDGLAASAIRFTAARSAVPLTLPSHTTILTGLLPPQHGVRENGIDQPDAKYPTVATLLKGAGYSTAAFVGAFVLDRRFGLARGFDTYDDQIPRDPNATERLEAERPASVVVDRALAWLKVWDQGRRTDQGPRTDQAPSTKDQGPFFVWLHLYDPHAPYDPPPGVAVHTTSRYDAEIAYTDAQVARVLQWLHAVALEGRTMIMVAGDHGEGLGDHGERTHGMLLYDSTLRVPLIVAAPGKKAEERREAVSLADIAPTILRAAHVTPPTEMQGRDLLAEVRLKADATYSETEYPRVAGWAPLQALTDGRWKTIRAGAASEVYDLQSDPHEAHDLASSQPNVVTAMSTRIGAIRAAGGAQGSRHLSPEAEQRLRSLGYVASSASSAVDDGKAVNPAGRMADWTAFEDALSALNTDPRRALPALEALARREPDAQLFQTTYARALKEAGQIDRALVIYRAAARRWAADPIVLHDFAVAAREAAERVSGTAANALREEATRAEQAAITLAPSSATAHNGLGLLAADADRPREAAAEFQRATEIDSNNASYWANLGNARRALGDRGGAEQAYRRALDVDAREADAANGLGVLLVDAQKPAEAVAWFERATAAAPDFVEARLNLGIALQQSGQPARAADVYRSVLAAPSKYKREREAATKLLGSLKR